MWCGCSCSLCSCFPVPSPGPKARFDRLTNRLEAGRATAYGSSEEFARSIDEISTHPMLEALKEVGDTDWQRDGEGVSGEGEAGFQRA